MTTTVPTPLCLSNVRAQLSAMTTTVPTLWLSFVYVVNCLPITITEHLYVQMYFRVADLDPRGFAYILVAGSGSVF
jgi:hypothetical protein